MMIRKILSAALLLAGITTAHAGEPFRIRGVLPWHNFLSGPSAWNERDYEKYLDQCAAEGINFIGFHNYTGGGERYATYVEPMLRISYKGITPTAQFDNSSTARWGYLPMPLDQYAYGSAAAFDLPRGARWFGSDVSVTARSAEEHYQGTQQLMRRVLEMAHQRGIAMAMGFEFGVIPPEYFSLNAPGDCFYWSGEANMVPNPKSQIAIDIHKAALDDLLASYPDIDYVWLWLNEHSFMSVDTQKAMQNKPFAEAYARDCDYFKEASDAKGRFVGVWALEYIRLTYDYLKAKGSKAQIILGGWGGGNQLPSLLKGLDRALPEEIIFSCLNPDLGKSPQPDFLADLARNRRVWAVPWLEGDHQLWHFQPRVDKMREHVSLAARQELDGVVAIHWRTEEVRFNFRTFARYASDKGYDRSTESLYEEFLTGEFGAAAGRELAPLLAKMDCSQFFWNVPSPEFYAYTPEWGLLDATNAAFRKDLTARIERLAADAKGAQREGLLRFGAMLRFELLLDEVQRALGPAFDLKKTEAEFGKTGTAAQYRAAYDTLCAAPVEQLFKTYLARVHSRGEMGVLSSLNQRLWREYNLLKNWLETKI